MEGSVMRGGMIYAYNFPADDVPNGKTFLGILDYSWLFSYAIAMYFR